MSFTSRFYNSILIWLKLKMQYKNTLTDTNKRNQNKHLKYYNSSSIEFTINTQAFIKKNQKNKRRDSSPLSILSYLSMSPLESVSSNAMDQFNKKNIKEKEKMLYRKT